MGTLDILPIGTRAVSGEYEGCVYYSLNTDRRSPQRFFTYSDLRPTFYEKRSKRFREQATVIWNLDTPLNNYMHTELKLKNAKVSIGHLSSSSKTEVTVLVLLSLTAPRSVNLLSVILLNLPKRFQKPTATKRPTDYILCTHRNVPHLYLTNTRIRKY